LSSENIDSGIGSDSSGSGSGSSTSDSSGSDSSSIIIVGASKQSAVSFDTGHEFGLACISRFFFAELGG